MIEYMVVCTMTLSGLNLDVNKELKEGWLPLGGMMPHNKSRLHDYCQTLVRDSESIGESPSTE